MTRSALILLGLLFLLGSPRSDADEAKTKIVRLAFIDRYTIDVPNGWKRVNNKETYQIESGDGKTVLTAARHEAPKNDWNMFWKTRMKADFPSLAPAGKIEMVSHNDQNYRKHPLSILCRYEGKVTGVKSTTTPSLSIVGTF